MRLCKDCIHCQLLIAVDGFDYSKCQHPQLRDGQEISLVTGKVEPHLLPYASTMRKGECGVEGQLFEGLI